MSAIVLAALNARYPHCSFGLRYLLANLGPLQSEACLREFTINQPTLDILDAILTQQPRIVALGVYIWNVNEVTRLVADLKRISPGTLVVVGGPEVSYEFEATPLAALVDVVISGEADLEFPRICQQLLDGQVPAVRPHIVTAAVPDLNRVRLPYDLYTDEDLAHRVIYVEASRGCPFTCEFCLSALEIPVRQFPLEAFLDAMQRLLDRGVRQFKFVDRTFNLNPRVSQSILRFFLQRLRPGLFLHFELVPDRLPEALQELICQFPPGTLQFEIGIQTWNDDVSERISRRQDNDLVASNLLWLRNQTGVHLHTDLIVGLPGETVESFAAGFDRLVQIGPHEIQVGILKRLRGTPILRHDGEYGMVYSPNPPYEILQTGALSRDELQVLRRFARAWDQVVNSGNFVESAPLLWTGAPDRTSPFVEFRRFSEWVFEREQQSTGIALSRWIEYLLEYLIDQTGIDSTRAAESIWRDYQRGGRSDKPHCLRQYLGAAQTGTTQRCSKSFPKRQNRRLNLGVESSKPHASGDPLAVTEPARVDATSHS